MKTLFEKPVVLARIVVLALIVIVVVAGAVVTIVDPDSLSFHDYVQDLVILASALSIGGGIASGLESYSHRPYYPPKEGPSP